jgi:hypothetical protein
VLFLILRIIITPLGVLGGTLAQRRLGHTVGGLIIGLPLVGLPLLWLVALQHGAAFTGSMTNALLVGSIPEALVLWIYARMTTRFSPSRALASALVAFVISVSIIGIFRVPALLAGALTVAGFAVALRWWPELSPDSSTEQGRSRLATRVALATIFTVILVSLAGRIGSTMSGLIDALPATTMMMTFMTSQEQGRDASGHFLRGVARGSFSYVVSMVVLAELLRTGNMLLAFSMSLVAALIMQLGLQIFDTYSKVLRGLVSTQQDLREVERINRADESGERVAHAHPHV